MAITATIALNSIVLLAQGDRLDLNLRAICEFFDLQTYDLVDSIVHLNLKSDFRVHRVRQFLKWLAFVTETGRVASA